MSIKFFFYGVLLFSSLLHASLPDLGQLNHTEMIILSSHEMKNCYFMIVKIQGKKYLIKQKKDGHKPLSAVKEALSSYIAKILNIAHLVDIIPPHIDFPGKFIANWPATIHTFVEGTSAHKYGKLRLKQFWKSFMEETERGLTPAIIRDMARHHHLAMIVALDTLIGNTDRHGNNLIVNLEKNTFCAIDMDDTWNKDLCAFNCKKLRLMVQEMTYPFTYQELEGLRIYRDTLKKLISAHSPQKIKKKFRYFIQKAGIVPGSGLYSANTPGLILFYERVIDNSWESAHELIALLDKLLLICSSTFYT